MSRPQYDHLGRVIDNFDEDLTHYPYQGEVNEDGFANISFGPSQTVRGMVRPGAALDFEVGEHGRVDSETLILLIRNEYGADEHDRIIFEGEERRLVEQQVEYLNDFSMFELIPDGRGGGSSGDGTSGDDDYREIPEDEPPTTDDPTRI